jgi:hypothetical protein
MEKEDFQVIPMNPSDVMHLIENFADHMTNKIMTDVEEWNQLTGDVLAILKISDIPPHEAIICLLRIACAMYQTARLGDTKGTVN